MKRFIVLATVLTLALGAIVKADPTVAEVTHSEFQAVDESGEHTYSATDKVVLEGILLHNPADMLDPTPDDTITDTFNISGQWQIFFQGEGDDHAGTAVWLGQLYNNLPWVAPEGGYSNEEFIAELSRLNAAQFSPGDRIRVTGYYLSYNGKLNINEQHNKNPDHDFTIELVERGVGLPRPEVVTLDELKDADDDFIFDPNRQTGCEYYQARLIKIEDVYFADANDWGPREEVVITDGTKTFGVKFGRGNGIYAGSNNLTEPFDVIGIMDQESPYLIDGYRLYVMNYDGNGSVLASPEHRMADKKDDTDQNWANSLTVWSGNIENYNGTRTGADALAYVLGPPDSDVDGNGYAWDAGDNDYVAGWKGKGDASFTVYFESALLNVDGDDLVVKLYGGANSKADVYGSIDGSSFEIIGSIVGMKGQIPGKPGFFHEAGASGLDRYVTLDFGTLDNLHYIRFDRAVSGEGSGMFFDAVGSVL